MTNLIRIMFALILVPFGTSALAAVIIIDRVDIIGDAKIDAGELARNLEIPIGRSIPADDASELLSEAEHRLKASGKYKDDVSLKLVKSDQAPHFILIAQLREIESWYFGADAHYVNGPSELVFDAEPGTHSTTDAEVYFGNRDFNGQGLALDLEFMANSSQYLYNSTYNFGKFKGKSEFYIGGLTATAIQKGLLGEHVYLGALVRSFHLKSWWSSSSNFNYPYDGKIYTTLGSTDSTEQTVYSSLEPLFGIGFGKLQLGGKLSRSLSRVVSSRKNADTQSTVDGVPQKNSSTSTFISETDGRYSFDNNAEFTIAWSDKSRLTVIEPGLDIHATWSRAYRSHEVDAPQVLAHAEYTHLFSEQFAGTLLSDEIWEYRTSSSSQTRLKRVLDLGTRIDFVTNMKMVLFCELYRIGTKRNEAHSGSHAGAIAADNRINAGFKYASPSMIYSLSFGYGSPLAGEQFFGGSIDSVYKRLGVR